QKSKAFACFNALMHNSQPASSTCLKAYGLIPEPESTPIAPSILGQQAGHLDADQSASVSVSIDAQAAGAFEWTWTGAVAPDFTLTGPDNQVIDPAYAAAHSNEVTYSSIPGTDVSFSRISYQLSNAQAGNWQLQITAGAEPVDYSTTTVMETTRTLTLNS